MNWELENYIAAVQAASQSAEAVDWDSLLKYAATFFAGLLTPTIMEFIKSWLSVRDSERAIKRDLIAKLKVSMGHLHAVEKLLQRALHTGPAEILSEVKMDQAQVNAWRAMQSFDLQPVYGLIEHITRLDLRQSSKSSAGQVLTEKLLLVLSAMKHVQTIEPSAAQNSSEKNPKYTIPRSDLQLVTLARDQLWELQLFIIERYAKILNITNPIDFGDVDLSQWEFETTNLLLELKQMSARDKIARTQARE